jgi:nucleoid DNA-binding protein
MIPKKPSEIIKATAEEMNISETKVDDIVSFFYKELRKNLSDLTELKIENPGLGYFIVRSLKVDNSIKDINRQLNNVDTKSFKGYHSKKTLEDKLKKLEDIKVKIDAFFEHKTKFRNEQAKYHLEKQKTNNGGNKEFPNT